MTHWGGKPMQSIYRIKGYWTWFRQKKVNFLSLYPSSDPTGSPTNPLFARWYVVSNWERQLVALIVRMTAFYIDFILLVYVKDTSLSINILQQKLPHAHNHKVLPRSFFHRKTTPPPFFFNRIFTCEPALAIRYSIQIFLVPYMIVSTTARIKHHEPWEASWRS